MSELEGVVLCGGSGSRMTELTSSLAKCLLPIAGVPMFWYPINTLVKSGIKDIKLFFRDSCEAEVNQLFTTPMFQFEGVSFEKIFMGRETEEWGTADVLRHYHTKITRDVIIISGDFVSDALLTPMIDQFRAHKASFTCLLNDNCVTGPVPGPKIKRNKGRDLIAMVEATNRLIFMCLEEDFDAAVNAQPWIEKFPNISLTAGLNDCHVYLVRSTLLQSLQKLKKCSSLKADFIPHLLAQQYGTGDSVEPLCLAYVLPHENGTVTAHANTIGAYFEVNKAILKCLPRFSARLSPGLVFNFRETSISVMDSRVDAGAKVSPHVVIKRSSIGKCVLNEKSRVQNSLLMDGVRIGKGSTVSSSIICAGAIIEDGAEVNNCIVDRGQTVPANAKIQNDVVEADEDNGEWATEA